MIRLTNLSHLMRVHHITIRALARFMDITLTRVRAVRNGALVSQASATDFNEAVFAIVRARHYGAATHARRGDEPAPAACPGCSGAGILTDDPQVLQCERCGGVFTLRTEPITLPQATAVVRLHLPMQAEAGAEGAYYFDLTIVRGPGPLAGTVERVHGWADRTSKRVVQYG
jgi:hypothetical protein